MEIENDDDSDGKSDKQDQSLAPEFPSESKADDTAEDYFRKEDLSDGIKIMSCIRE
jgi:hypothetical protein